MSAPACSLPKSRRCIAGYDGLAIRSATKVTAELIAAGATD